MGHSEEQRYEIPEVEPAEASKTAGRPVLAGPAMLEALQPSEWGTTDVEIVLPPAVMGDKELDAQESSTSYLIAHDISPAEVVDMISKRVRPGIEDSES